jgi:hypothetical protein
MADLRTRIEEARKEGYSDDEIASFLSGSNPRVQEAIREGYTASEVLQFLTSQPAAQAVPQAAPATPAQTQPAAPEVAPPQGDMGGAFRGIRSDMTAAQPSAPSAPPAPPAPQQPTERPWWTRGLIDLLQAPEGQSLSQAARNELLGLIRGAADIGTTLVEVGRTTPAGGPAPITTLPERFKERQQQITAGMEEMGAQVNAPGFTGGRLAGQIAGTAGVGPVVGGGLRAVGATRLGEAVAAGGFGPSGAGGVTGARGIGLRAAGGGIGGGTAAALTDMTPEGAATGGAIGAVLPVAARPVGSVLGGLYQGFVRPFAQTKELSEDILAETLGKHLEGTPLAISRGAATPSTPGFERTLPEMIEAGGGRATTTLAEMANRLQSSSQALNQQIGDQIERRVGALQSQLLRAQTQMQTQGSVLAPAAIEDLRRVQAQIQDQIAKEQAALDVVRAAKFQELPVSMQAPGQTLSNVAKELQDKLRETVIRPAYKKALDSAGNTKTDIQNVVAEAERLLERPLSNFAPETAPSLVRKIAGLKSASQVGPQLLSPDGRPIEKPAMATLGELDDLRKAINDSFAEAKVASSQLSPTIAANLKNLHATIDDAVQGSSVFSKETKDLYRNAVANYRELYAPRFRKGPAASILKPGRYSDQQLMPSDVVGAFFEKEDLADNFVRTFAGDARAFQAMRDGVLTKFRDEVASSGVISEAAARAFMSKNAAVLKKLDDAGVGIAPKLAEIEAQSAAMERAVAKVKELGGGFDRTRTPEEVLNYMLSDPARMGIAMKKVGADGKDVIRRVITSDLTSAIDSANPATAVDMLTNKNGTLKGAYRVALGNDLADAFLERAKAAVQMRALMSAPEVVSRRGVPPLLEKGKFTQDELTSLQAVVDDVERMKSIAELAEQGAKVAEPSPGKLVQQEARQKGTIRPLDIQFLNTTASIIRNTFSSFERMVEARLANELAYLVWTNPQAAKQAIENSLRRRAQAARAPRVAPAVPAAAGVVGADALQFE